MNLKKLFLFTFSILVGLFVYAQIYEDADSAFNKASTDSKPILLIFTGSDWCPHCLRFEKNILYDQTFVDYAAQNLVILQADFPQRKKLPKEIVIQNDKLAEKYNPKGEFPTFLILNPKRTKSSYFEYRNQEPVEFISQIESKIKFFEHNE